MRYLGEAYRALRQVVPPEHRTVEVEEIIEWLGEVVRSVDSLAAADLLAEPSVEEPRLSGVSKPQDGDGYGGITANRAAFRLMVRNAMFRLVELAAHEDYDGLASRTATPSGEWDADAWANALDPLFVTQGDDAIGITTDARAQSLLTIREPGQELPPGFTIYESDTVPEGYWWVRQVFDDADGDHDWSMIALIDLAANSESESPVIRIQTVGPA